MPVKSTCPTCKGEQIVEYLISMHDDETESGVCHNCYGRGYVNVMTDEEENDYWSDYW